MRFVVLLMALISVSVAACDDGDGAGDGTPSAIEPTPPARATPPEPGETEEHQTDVVEAFIARTTNVRVACLDVNSDGLVDATDADPAALADITGDDVVDEADLGVIRDTNIVLSEEKPAECADGHPSPDWQVSSPVPADCAGRAGGLVLLAVGGGAVELSSPTNAAGVRWMLVKIGEKLEERGIPHQLTSVNPGLVGTESVQPDSEAWALSYLSTQVSQQPCLRIVLLGHSHGGVAVTAIAARLEEAGLGDRILVTAVIDRVAFLYGGDTESIPQTSPVLNLYQTNDDIYMVRPIDQPNIENVDVSSEQAPAQGEQGGELVSVGHGTLDNSQAALDLITERILEDACNAGLC